MRVRRSGAGESCCRWTDLQQATVGRESVRVPDGCWVREGFPGRKLCSEKVSALADASATMLGLVDIRER